MKLKHYGKTPILALDDDEAAGLVLVTRFRGGLVSVTRARIHELLAREAEWLDAAAGAPHAAAAEDDAAPVIETLSRQTPGESVTHASLSSRITKIHAYSKGTRRIRPAHAGLIADLLESFDGVIPLHASGQLEAHLNEFCAWDAVPEALKAQVGAFLDRYRKQRQAG